MSMIRYNVVERYGNGETQNIGTGIAVEEFSNRIVLVTSAQIAPENVYDVFLRTDDTNAFQVEIIDEIEVEGVPRKKNSPPFVYFVRRLKPKVTVSHFNR